MQKKILFIIFFIITLDMMGIGLLIPVVAPMLLNSNSPFVPPETSLQTRILFQGLVLGIYPFFQFFGSPFLGILADNKGRKKILLLTLSGTLLGYFLSSIAIPLGFFWLFFLARALDGFTGGNISIANAVISDISEPEEKAKNFGIIGAAFGVGIVIGPFLGGVLSDSTLVSWFSFEIPFLFAIILSLINIFLVWKFLPETLKREHKKKRKITLFLGFTQIKQAFLHPILQKLFLVLFLYIGGFAFFTNFFQVFAIEKFNFTPSDIGIIFAYLGVCIIFAQTVFVRWAVKKFPLEILVRVALFTLSFLLILLPFLPESWMFFVLFFFMALSNGILFSNLSAIISNEVSPSEQGEIMGIKESLQAIGNAVPAFAASIIGGFFLAFPLYIAGFLIFCSGLIFLFRGK